MGKQWKGDAWEVEITPKGRIMVGFSDEKLRPYQALQLAEALTQASNHVLHGRHKAT